MSNEFTIKRLEACIQLLVGGMAWDTTAAIPNPHPPLPHRFATSHRLDADSGSATKLQLSMQLIWWLVMSRLLCSPFLSSEFV